MATSNSPLARAVSSGKTRSFSSWEKCGNSHSRVNSARWWYHHHTEVPDPVVLGVRQRCRRNAPGCRRPPCRCDPGERNGVGGRFSVLADGRRRLIERVHDGHGQKTEAGWPATAAVPGLTPAIHAGGWGSCTGFGVIMRRGKSKNSLCSS